MEVERSHKMTQEQTDKTNLCTLTILTEAEKQYRDAKNEMTKRLTDRGVRLEWLEKSHDRLKLSFADNVLDVLSLRKQLTEMAKDEPCEG